MTQQDFDSLRFCAGMLAEYGGHWYKVISCNFPERLFALYDDAGIDADDPKWGFATDDAIDEIFRNLPRLVRDKRDGSIELIDYDNAAEWRGDLERKPSLYQWLPINGNTL